MLPAAAPHPATLALVRDRVRRVLTSTPAFQALDAPKRQEIARAMVNIGQFLVDAGGETHDLPVEMALATTPPPPDTAGEQFKDQGGAVAAEAGAAAFEGLVNKVDFPKFVAGLIDGVFNAIVSSSIKQMQAYAELVKNVSGSVDDFMKDNVSENQARDYLADRYPDHFEVDVSGDAPTLKPKDGADDATMPDFHKDLGMAGPVDGIDADTTESQLVPAARRRMAHDRQRLLLAMVLMGINRLVVTNGSIKAAVVFNLATTDKVKKTKKRATDYKEHDEWSSSDSGGWFSSESWSNSGSADYTVSTINDQDSAATVDLKAKLSGDVNIQFKSETFPLEQMTSIIGIDTPKAPARPVPQAAAAPAG